MNVASQPGRLERITSAVERYPDRALVATALTAVGGAVAFFLLGFNYRKDIQEAALLDLVPRGSYVLKSDIPDMLTPQQVKERYVERQIVDREYVRRDQATSANSSIAPNPKQEPATRKAPLQLSLRIPFPAGYDAVAPGMKLSEAVHVLPGGRFTAGDYQLSLPDGPFSTIVFFTTSPQDSDPTISSIAFLTADGVPNVMETALREFGSHPHRSEVLGTRNRLA